MKAGSSFYFAPADLELKKAIECIDRAGTLTREGMAQARRAILALREDAAPLPDQLAKLADLRDRGVITTDEFEREKAKVLAA